MLILSLAAVARAPTPVRGEIAPDDPLWSDTSVALASPLKVDLQAQYVGEGVLARGEVEASLEMTCRRCLSPVLVRLKDSIDLLYEPMSAEDEDELGGEVHALPERGDQLDLAPAIREQVVLRVPEFVVCGEACRGLCPKCGVDLNRDSCDCAPVGGNGHWDALKKYKFD